MPGTRSRLLPSASPLMPNDTSAKFRSMLHEHASASLGGPPSVLAFDPYLSENLDVLHSPRSVLDQRVSGIAVEEKQARCSKSGLEVLLSSSRCFVGKRSTSGASARLIRSTVPGMQDFRDQETHCSACLSTGVSATTQSHPMYIVKNHLQPWSKLDDQHKGRCCDEHQAFLPRSDPGPRVPSPCHGPDSDRYARKSIFSTAESSSTDGHENTLVNDFLSACFFCKRRLGLGKDIFMYRGDRAFCSAECRYQQIVADERKEECASAACKGLATGVSGHRKNFWTPKTAA